MNHEELKNKASHYRQSPPADTWQKLDFVLQSRSSYKKQKNTLIIRVMSFAAIMLLIFAFVFLLQTDKSHIQQAPVFDSTAQNEVISPIYSNSQMDGLRKAYAKVFPEQNKGL